MNAGRASLLKNLVALGVVLAVTSGFCWLIFSKLGGLEWKMITDARGVFFAGWLRTVFASLIALIVATTTGVLLMACQRSRYAWLREKLSADERLVALGEGSSQWGEG